MKNNFSILLMAVLFCSSHVSHAQSVLVVEPGIGTLNNAINTYGGTKIYQLKAGEWYQLTAVIQNLGYHLQIVGQEPTIKGGLPATLQTGNAATGGAFGVMFDAKSDITLRNIYLVNSDLNSVVGTSLLSNSGSNARTVIDRCIIDPVSSGNAITMSGANSKLYFTNNLCNRQGHQLNPNDGHFFVDDNLSGAGFDTIIDDIYNYA